MIDVSIVLNVHRGVNYFRRTMLSLEDAVDYAVSAGVKIELIVVLDNSDQISIDWYNAYESSRFVAYQVLQVANGALGASRADGIAMASGQYVMTYDEDDLVSFNYILSLLDLARKSSVPALVFPGYLLAFGSSSYLYKMHSPPLLSKLAFLERHPLISRYLAPRSLFETVKYSNLSAKGPYAFEDWHFNCEALSAGVEISIAPSAILFYRQRNSGLLKSSSITSTRQIPPSSFFEPEKYISICKPDFTAFNSSENAGRKMCDIKTEFLGSSICLEASRIANTIDSGVDIHHLQHYSAFSNIDSPLSLGAAYYQVCERLIGKRFDRVCLVGSLSDVEGCRAFLKFIADRDNAETSRQTLLLAVEGGEPHALLCSLDSHITFIDIFNQFDLLSREDQQVIVLKLIQSVSSSADLIAVANRFVFEFIDRFWPIIKNNKKTLYVQHDSTATFVESGGLARGLMCFLDCYYSRLDEVVISNGDTRIKIEADIGVQAAAL